MPELPEVETIRRGLAPLREAFITGVSVHHERAIRRNPTWANPLQNTLQGRRIDSIERRGKFLWLNLDNALSLVIHLGMSGQLRFDDNIVTSHERIVMHTTHSTVRFIDQRTFGHWTISPQQEGVPLAVSHIARDVLDPLCDLKQVSAVIRNKKSAIKRVLLDQKTISGIGNIYADEALWAAKIHPETPALCLSEHQVMDLLLAVRAVQVAAIALGGTSFDALYTSVNGSSGTYSTVLTAYGQAGKPCRRCGEPIIRSSFMNRSSFYCSHCQPATYVKLHKCM